MAVIEIVDPTNDSSSGIDIEHELPSITLLAASGAEIDHEHAIPDTSLPCASMSQILSCSANPY